MASELLADPFHMMCNSPAPEPTKSGKKSWLELRKAVRDTRKVITSLASSVPSQFVFRKIHTDTGTLTRLYFLGVPAKSRENTFLYVDIPEESVEPVPYLTWKQLLHPFQMMPLSGHMSKQEQLLRERKRLGVVGITYFDFVEKEGKFVFPAHNSMFFCKDDDINNDEALFPEVVCTSSYQTCLNPMFCPSNSDLVAFVLDGDISVMHLTSRCQRRLTHVHKGTGNLNDDPVSAGEPSFVIQEEFDRFTGYWWQPVKKYLENGHETYNILFEEVDETRVDILHTFAPTTDNKQMDMYRYPRAGTDNAESTLKIVEFAVNSKGQISENSEIKTMRTSLKTFFPWMEYLVRADWTPDGKYVYAELLSRQQDRLALVLIPEDCFVYESHEMDISTLMSRIHVLVEDQSDIWVNVHNLLHFFPQEKDDEITFLWSSEKTGFRHLYLIKSRLQHMTESVIDFERCTFDEYFKPNIIFEVTLTSGEWEVLPKEFFVDEEKARVYFTGLKDTVLEPHLYVVSYLYPAEPIRLTELGFSHYVSFNNDCSMFVTVYSSLECPPRCCVRRLTEFNEQLSSEPLGHLIKPMDESEYQPPILFDFMTEDGCQLYGMCYKPYNMEPGVKYPTVLFVYGGPQVQLVNNSFKGLKFLRLHTLATQGYSVVLIDGRGSCHRGLKFESHINGCLGNVELEDQVAGLHWLSSHVDFIDLNRVAIHGWSYGGYLSLMGLAQKSNIFKLAIAGAPVVNWRLYDTGYTERYMNLPNINPSGYNEGSVLFYIDMFPDEENRLLIIHGLLDENVHFHHTNCLVNELIRSCKPYRLQVYPNERHGIRNHDASEHYKTMVLSFLQAHL
ncbi:dipeptidyl peptidase 9 [Octopus bimaculoides]|uniref:dipeptidyl peptidase 9 n=1 Tax=Octopus bimaculoides TaxID=37653 RepID=UPI0022E4FD8F|nr:dipeptidyl peptidase 9 [Octopus bimaculoides]XP_052830442.1 dipeptidyl peptidase 9 [Octopus bimaculoides]